ncbi:hypothetical protein HN011_010621 [Eciton burchellii]|nr:hypothetical protein HN011_010621 [Eciton burchellii]
MIKISNKHLTVESTEPPFEPGKIRLYSMRICPYAQKIHLVLDAKQIPYNVIYVNLISKPKWFIEKNPTGKVPCIELKPGEILKESLIIADYLDEAYPEIKLYPNNLWAKAKDKLLINQFNEIEAIVYKLLLEMSESVSQQEMFNKFLSGLDMYERELEKRNTTFFGGSKPNMLDFMIWPCCERIDAIRILRGEHFVLPQERFPLLFEWRNVMKKNSIVQISYLDPEICVKYVRSRLSDTSQCYQFLNEILTT